MGQDAQLVGCLLAGLKGICDPLISGTGIGIAAVYHRRKGLSAFNMALGRPSLPLKQFISVVNIAVDIAPVGQNKRAKSCFRTL